jgi:hypothetical protein
MVSLVFQSASHVASSGQRKKRAAPCITRRGAALRKTRLHLLRLFEVVEHGGQHLRGLLTKRSVLSVHAVRRLRRASS